MDLAHVQVMRVPQSELVVEGQALALVADEVGVETGEAEGCGPRRDAAVRINGVGAESESEMIGEPDVNDATAGEDEVAAAVSGVGEDCGDAGIDAEEVGVGHGQRGKGWSVKVNHHQARDQRAPNLGRGDPSRPASSHDHCSGDDEDQGEQNS
jgi:hypothetical protein